MGEDSHGILTSKGAGLGERPSSDPALCNSAEFSLAVYATEAAMAAPATS